MLNIIWPTPSNSFAKPIWSCPFAPWRWATISTRLAIPEHFCLCSQQSLLYSWLMPPGASCCHWAEWDLSGKLQGKWSVTQSLAGPLPVTDNGTKSFQVSFLWSTSQQGSAWLCYLSPWISQCSVTGGIIGGTLQACAWVFSLVLVLRDHSISFRFISCLCLQEGNIFCALFQETVNYRPTRALVFATVGTSLV